MGKKNLNPEFERCIEKGEIITFGKGASLKHAGILSYFNKRFIKEGTFSEELGRSINNAFELRQRGDYREYVELSYEQVSPFIGKARDFIARVTDYLEATSFIKKG